MYEFKCYEMTNVKLEKQIYIDSIRKMVTSETYTVARMKREEEEGFPTIALIKRVDSFKHLGIVIQEDVWLDMEENERRRQLLYRISSFCIVACQHITVELLKVIVVYYIYPNARKY